MQPGVRKQRADRGMAAAGGSLWRRPLQASSMASAALIVLERASWQNRIWSALVAMDRDGFHLILHKSNFSGCARGRSAVGGSHRVRSSASPPVPRQYGYNARLKLNNMTADRDRQAKRATGR